LVDEFPFVSLKQNIILLKKWVEPFFIFFIMLNILDNKKTCKKALFGLGILLLITAMSGPLTSFNIINIGRVFGSGRASGFGNTNSFAAYLVLFIPLVLTFVLFHKSNTFRTYSAVVLFTTLIALIFTGSRGGILSFVASIFGYLFMLYSQKAIRLGAIFSVMVTVLMVSTISFVLAPSKVQKLVSYRIDPTKSVSYEHYSSGRLRLWHQSISLFLEKTIFGHGHRSTLKLMERRYGQSVVAHNQYLNYLVEFGIIGCALFILIILKIFHIIWNFMKITPDPWEKKLYIGYIAGLLGYTSSMVFISLAEARYIFWFYTAVFLRYGQLQEIGEENNDGALTTNESDGIGNNFGSNKSQCLVWIAVCNLHICN
jgi:O-antigen ligase